jgi:hypothetical protein
MSARPAVGGRHRQLEAALRACIDALNESTR